MTCIVGLVDKGKVYIGGDSASVSGYNIHSTNLQKVFRNEKFIIGYTTSFRMGQILQYHLNVPKKENMSDEEYMVIIFVETVRKCFKKFGFSEVKDNEETGGSFLVAFNKKLYQIDSDYQVNKFRERYTSIGAGEAYALGSLFGSTRLNAEDRINLALKAAAKHSIMVIPPFKILTME